MTLQEYIDRLGKLVKEHPECLEYQVVTAKDDEGNGFNPVHYSPSMGNFDGEEFYSDKMPTNTVCLN